MMSETVKPKALEPYFQYSPHSTTHPRKRQHIFVVNSDAARELADVFKAIADGNRDTAVVEFDAGPGQPPWEMNIGCLRTAKPPKWTVPYTQLQAATPSFVHPEKLKDETSFRFTEGALVFDSKFNVSFRYNHVRDHFVANRLRKWVSGDPEPDKRNFRTIEWRYCSEPTCGLVETCEHLDRGKE